MSESEAEPESEAVLSLSLLDRPDDPTLYAVYADRLIERGDPRGDLIQVQLRLEALSPDDPARTPLLRRARTLRRLVHPSWLQRRPRCLWRFRRGFLDSLAIEWAVLRARVNESPDPGAGLSHLRHLSLRWSHQVGTPIPAEDLAAILAIPELRRVEHLEVTRSTLDPDACRALSHAHLPRLRSLNLEYARFNPANTSPFRSLPNLQHPSLHQTQFPVAAAVSFADGSSLSNLTELRLACTDLDDPAAAVLSAAPALARLERLDLSWTLITEVGLQSVLRLPRLSHLHLAGIRLTPDGVRALVEAPPLLTRVHFCFFNPVPAALEKAFLLRYPDPPLPRGSA